MKPHYKKIILIFLLSAMIFVFGGLKMVYAWTFFGIGDIKAKVVGTIAEAIGGILGFISGILLNIAGYLVELALNINKEIITSLTVQAGWQIVLNLTNLGFILAIIIIAFATIFRMQSYAMKQILWKLIVAALLVNFSLVIAGAFINISDIFSDFFMEQGGITSVSEWSTAFASMFKAQALLKITESYEPQGGWDVVTATINEIGTDVLLTIGSIFFVAIFTVLTALTLLAVAIMLLIRYVYLGILLILSPIVWLLWIFPNTQSLWQKWWNNFLRWTFFAPIMLFFIYLALYAMQNQGERIQAMARLPKTTKGVPLLFGVGVIGEMVIVIGLVMGGLIAANSLGIYFASTAYGWAQGINKTFGSWVGRKGIQMGTAAFRGEKGKGFIEGMQKTGLGKGGFGRFVTAPIRQLGSAISGTAGIGAAQAEKLVKQAEAKLDKLQSQQIALGLSTMSNDEKIAAFNILRKRKDVDMVPYLERYLTKKTKNMFESYNKKGDFEDLEKSIGLNADAIEAAKAGNADKVKKSLESLYQNMRAPHFATMQADDLFGDPTIKRPPLLKDLAPAAQEMIQRQGAGAMLAATPESLATVYRGLKGKNLDYFHKLVMDYIGKQPEGWLKERHPEAAQFYSSDLAQRLGVKIS